MDQLIKIRSQAIDRLGVTDLSDYVNNKIIRRTNAKLYSIIKDEVLHTNDLNIINHIIYTSIKNINPYLEYPYKVRKNKDLYILYAGSEERYKYKTLKELKHIFLTNVLIYYLYNYY